MYAASEMHAPQSANHTHLHELGNADEINERPGNREWSDFAHWCEDLCARCLLCRGRDESRTEGRERGGESESYRSGLWHEGRRHEQTWVRRKEWKEKYRWVHMLGMISFDARRPGAGEEEVVV